MLIFGSSVGGWQEKARYAEDKADNEFAEVREVRCDGITDVQTALATIAAFAADTKCKKFLYHATINLNPGERLTPEQWKEAVERLEERLNLKGHHRVVFEHIKKDRQHYHIYWSRFPPKGGAAVNMSNDYITHQKTAKELEVKFGLKPAPRKAKGQPSKKKQEINDRNNGVRVKPEIVTKDATRIYRDSRTTQDFIKNLQAEGYVLTRGKKGSYVLVDKQGGYHGLLRRIQGEKLADVEGKYPELKTMPLPSLNTVLRTRRGSPSSGFKKTTRITKAVRLRGSKRKNTNVLPRGSKLKRSLASAKRHKLPGTRKYYPPPLMRRKSTNALGKTQTTKTRWISNKKEKIHTTGSADANARKFQSNQLPVVPTKSVKPKQQGSLSGGGTVTTPRGGVGVSSPPAAFIKAHKFTVKKHQEQDQKPEPFKPMKPSGGWPEAALKDWIQWGYKDPAAFFAKWPELAANGPSSGGPR